MTKKMFPQTLMTWHFCVTCTESREHEFILGGRRGSEPSSLVVGTNEFTSFDYFKIYHFIISLKITLNMHRSSWKGS